MSALSEIKRFIKLDGKKNLKPGFERRWDGIQERSAAVVHKFDDDMTSYVARKTGLLAPKLADFEAMSIKPYQVTEDVGSNLVTSDGLQRLTNFLIGTGALVGMTSTTTRLGTGDSSTAATTADTDLNAAAGSTHRWFNVSDSAPTRVTTTVTNDTVQVVSTFATGDGNYAWQEWCINLGTATVASGNTVDASAGKDFFNHKVASLGTKASGASWALTVKISFA